MVSPSKEHLRPGGRPVTEGVGTDITPLQSTRGQDSCRQPAGRTFGGGEGPSLLLLVMLGVPSAEENKKHARHRFLISTTAAGGAAYGRRVEKPVPEAGGL